MESSEYFHADIAAAIGRAEVLNQMRFLVARPQLRPPRRQRMYEYLMDNGMTREEYHFFLDHRLKHHCIIGNDYYQPTSIACSPMAGPRRQARSSATERSRGNITTATALPVMHTETNLCEGPHGDEAVYWLWKEWANVLRLRNVGMPTLGFTWYSPHRPGRLGHRASRENGNVNPLGLFDLDRKIRNVGTAYKQLIDDWRDVLPASAVSRGANQEGWRLSRRPRCKRRRGRAGRFGGSGTRPAKAEKS